MKDKQIRNQTVWRSHLELSRRHPGGVGGCCKEQGISRASLYYWRRRLEPKSEQAGHFLNPFVWIAVGKAKDKRLMFVAYTIHKLGNERLLRPISARHIHRNSKEEKVYEEVRKKLFERE